MKKEMSIDPRVAIRSAKTQIKNPFNALVELIINSCDSYNRLKLENNNARIVDIIYGKSEGRTTFIVRDFAEGMSREKIEEVFGKFGRSTSGIFEGEIVTGFFGTGAKASLAIMDQSLLISIKDGIFTLIKVWEEDNKLWYDIIKTREVDDNIRKRFGIPEKRNICIF